MTSCVYLGASQNMANLIFGSSSWRMHTSQTHGSCSNVDMWRNPYMLLIPNHIFLVSSEFGWAMVHILARHSQAKIPMASLICTKTHQKGTTRYLSHPNSAVNPRISARGAYFKFSRRRGALNRGEGGRLFNFSHIVAWHDHFFNTSSAR